MCQSGIWEWKACRLTGYYYDRSKVLRYNRMLNQADLFKLVPNVMVMIANEFYEGLENRSVGLLGYTLFFGRLSQRADVKVDYVWLVCIW